MEESITVSEWIAKGVKRGEAIGEARGEARGKEIGKMEELQVAILRLGTKKFGAPPKGIEATIKAIQDHARLERVLDCILEATSWEDLLATP